MSATAEVKLFDNKQLLHIGAEVVVLLGLTFYFSSKNKKLVEHIENLSQRMEEQEDKIQKLELKLQQLTQVIPQLSQGLQQVSLNTNALADRMNSAPSHRANKERRRALPPRVSPVAEVSILKDTRVKESPSGRERSESPKQRVQFAQPSHNARDLEDVVKDEDDLEEPEETIAEEDEEELSDSDLDKEISEELKELSENEKDDESGLKKQV